MLPVGSSCSSVKLPELQTKARRSPAVLVPAGPVSLKPSLL